MPSKGLLIAAAFLVLLGGGVWWSNKKQAADAGKPAEGAAPKILTLTESDINRLEYKRKDGEDTALERDTTGAWKIISPAAYSTDRDSVNSLLSAVSAINSDKVVEEKPTDLNAFGLVQPSAVLTIGLKGGKTRILTVGDDAPVGGGAFVKVDSDGRVFTIASYTKTNLDKKAADLRDKRLLTFDSDKLARIELAGKGAPLEFSKNNQNEWAVIKPKPVRADGWQVEEFLRKLKEAKLDPALTADQQKDLAKLYAASAPLATASVTDAAGTQKLEIRKNVDNKYYAHSSAVEGFHLLTEDIGKSFEKTLDDFRNKKLFDFGFSDVTKLEYKDDTRQTTLTRAGERWLANSKAMDSVGVQSLIDRLRDLSASKFPETGFTAPLISITAVAKDGKLTDRVSISKVGDGYVAQREGEPTLYGLEAKTVDELKKAAADIKEAPAATPEKKK